MATTWGFDLKIERAQLHLSDLDTHVAQYLASMPFVLNSFEEPETGDLVFKVHIQTPPPMAWATIIGDLIHNLRSSLDLLIWQLVLANKRTPDKETKFPIAKSQQNFESSLKAIKGVSDAARAQIRNQRPYPEGNRTLWQLHELDIIDKHRLLIPVGAALRNVIVDLSAHHSALFPDSKFKDLPPMPIALNPADRQYPLTENAEVYRVMAAARPLGDQPPRITFELAFGEDEPVRGQPLLSTLHQTLEVVKATIDSFRRLLPNETQE